MPRNQTNPAASDAAVPDVNEVVIQHDDPPTKTEQKAALAPDADHEAVFAASMDMVRYDEGATEAVPEPEHRPIVVEVAGGGEFIVRATPARIEELYPGSTLLRYDDTGELV